MQLEDDEDKGQRGIQSIEVGGRLLQALTDRSGPMSLKDLAAAAELPASRAHPYLVSFGKLGLVEQDAHTGRYALGTMALQMGLACLHQSDPIKAATPVAEALAERLGESVVIAVWANFGPTVVRLIDGSQPLHVNMRAGTVMAVLGTATGRAFAAVLPTSQIEQAMRVHGDAVRADRSTVKNLARELKQITAEFRSHGVTRALGRPIPGVNAFSAPAFDHEGHAALVITALGHEDTFAPDWGSKNAIGVRQAAAEVSARLGFRA